VHVRGDVFRKMIVRGRDPITPELATRRFVNSTFVSASRPVSPTTNWRDDFTVVLQDIYAGDALANVVGRLEISPSTWSS